MTTIVRNVLPLNPKPSHYDLRIDANLDNFSFVGDVAIDLDFSEPESTITFNIAAIKILNGDFDGKFKFVEADFTVDEKNEKATVKLPEPASTGAHKLTLHYTGVIGDQMKGFYRAKYTRNGETAYMGTTQFEAVDCRRALPCWDEPVHKATFSVTLVAPNDLKVLSNTEEISRTNVEGNRIAVSFAKTPRMSTYLLAWTIGALESVETTIKKTRSGESTLIRVFAAEGKEQQGKFALDVAARVLPLYENFFGSDYILPKADLLAIPDFAAGAMENWGLITYRETALLSDEKSSARQRQWVALVVAHELAHQWFGNLVTMDWWKELWLNESFATWTEYWAVDQLFPDWQVFTQFVNDENGPALRLDAMETSHPVEVDVVNAEEIDEIFDAISYSKGGALLRMVVEFIGIDAFRTGLQKYLAHFAFTNATTRDLWKFLGEASGKDLQTVLEDWTGKQGYPWIKATAVSDGVELEQHRFLSGKPDPSVELDATVWKIPLLVRTSSSQAPIQVVMSERKTKVAIPTDAEFVNPNSNKCAFVRIMYDAPLRAKIGAAISAKKISNIDRWGVIADAHAFATAGHDSVVSALELLSCYTLEDDPTVWDEIVNLESAAKSLLRGKPKELEDQYNKWAQRLYGPIMKKLGMSPSDSDSHRDASLRPTVMSRLHSANDQVIIDELARLWNNRDAQPIPADLKALVYASHVKHGGQQGWDDIVALHDSTLDAMEKVRCLRSLPAAKEKAILEKTVEFALSDKARAQDSCWVLLGVAESELGGPLFLDVVTNRWEVFYKKYPGMIIGRILGSGLSYYSDVAVIDRLNAFFASIDAKERGSVERSVQQGMEKIRIKAAWVQRDFDNLAAWIGKQ